MIKTLEFFSKDEMKSLIEQSVQTAFQNYSSNQDENSNELMTTKQCMELLQCSRGTLWAMKKRGHIPYVRLNNHIRYERKKILESLKKINYKNINH